MKAIGYSAFGPPEVLKFIEINKPVPRENEVLIKVKAVALNKADYILMTGKPFLARPMVGSFLKPKANTVLGADMSGRIEAIGQNVKGFKVGDDVFGDLSANGFGALAEYVCADASILALKPENLTYEEVAAVPMASVTALKALRDVGQIQVGKRVLIYGASGGVGTFAVQIAKALGAEVTAVCSTRNVERVKALGADHVIDYTKEEFTQNGLVYDLIHAVNGNLSIFNYGKSLSPKGIYVMSGGHINQMFQAMLLGPLLTKKDGKTFGSVSSKPCQKDLLFIKELLEANKIKPVIAKTYAFSDAASAFQYLDAGHSEGKVLIQVW